MADENVHPDILKREKEFEEEAARKERLKSEEARSDRVSVANEERLSGIKERSAASSQKYQEHVEEVKSHYGQKRDPETPTPQPTRSTRAPEQEKPFSYGSASMPGGMQEDSSSVSAPKPVTPPNPPGGEGPAQGTASVQLALNKFQDALIAKLNEMATAIKNIGPLS
jgi:hypothetical protein